MIHVNEFVHPLALMFNQRRLFFSDIGFFCNKPQATALSSPQGNHQTIKFDTQEE